MSSKSPSSYISQLFRVIKNILSSFSSLERIESHRFFIVLNQNVRVGNGIVNNWEPSPERSVSALAMKRLSQRTILFSMRESLKAAYKSSRHQ